MSPSDTSPEAARVLAAAYRRITPGQKWLRLGALYDEARLLHEAGVRQRNPRATPREVQELWMLKILGVTFPSQARGPVMGEDRQADQTANLKEPRKFLKILESLKIPYAVGGSMASSVHGHDRYTRDVGITVEPFPGKEEQLAGSFGPDYYVSLPAIRDAVRTRTSFNIIDTRIAFKIDVFVRKDEPFEQSAMSRAFPISLPDKADESIVFHSPEDTVLFKLRWYRLGGETSDRQWSDILGVLQTQAGRLEDGYLDHWAVDLGVKDLLDRARGELPT